MGKVPRALLSEMLAFGTKEGLVMYVTVTDRHLLCSWKFYRMQDEKQSLLQEKERQYNSPLCGWLLPLYINSTQEFLTIYNQEFIRNCKGEIMILYAFLGYNCYFCTAQEHTRAIHEHTETLMSDKVAGRTYSRQIRSNGQKVK